jgi:hypothetical protein
MARLWDETKGDRRKDPRFAADIQGVLAWDGLSQTVTIRNISAYGALIHGPYLPAIGTRAELIADHLEVTVTIIWQDGESSGLLLSSPIDPYALLSDHRIDMVGHGVPVAAMGRPVGLGAYAA